MGGDQLKYRLSYSEIADGYMLVNGRPHGFKMKPQWEVTFSFDSKQDRTDFIKAVKVFDKVTS